LQLGPLNEIDHAEPERSCVGKLLGLLRRAREILAFLPSDPEQGTAAFATIIHNLGSEWSKLGCQPRSPAIEIFIKGLRRIKKLAINST